MLGRSNLEAIGGFAALAVVVILLFVLKSCASVGSPDDYNYRMTIYVNDGGVTRSFSAVRSVRFDSDFTFPDFRKNHSAWVRGEAIPIVVNNDNPFLRAGATKTYFALQDELTDAPAFRAMESAALKAAGSRDGLRDAMVELKGEYDLPRRLTRGDISDTPYNRDDAVKTWPVFVTFADPEKPESIKIVDPDDIGVTRITIQITSEDLVPRVGRMFSEQFWQRWIALQKRSVPERDADILGSQAAYYQIGPGQMRISGE